METKTCKKCLVILSCDHFRKYYKTCKKCTNAKENAKVNERNPEYFKNKYSDNSTARKAYASRQYEVVKQKKLLEAIEQKQLLETQAFLLGSVPFQNDDANARRINAIIYEN